MAKSGINDGYLSISSDEGSLDGYHFNFVNDDGFECIFCLKIIRSFVELPCGHAGCDYCVQQWEKKNMVCSVCNKKYNQSDKHKSLYFDRTIQHLKPVKCKQVDDGCQWEGAIHDYQNTHKKSCLLKKVKCKKCSASLKRVDQEKHETVCPCRNVKCLNCGMTHLFKDQKEHKDKFCFTPCEYAQYGCKEQVQFNKMEKHLSETARQHIEMVTKQNYTLTTQNCSSTAQNNTLTTQVNELKKELEKYNQGGERQAAFSSSTSSTNKRTYAQMTSDEKPSTSSQSKKKTLNNSTSATNDDRNLRKFLKWDGKKYDEVEINGKTFRFDEVWKMLKDKRFDDLSRIIKEQPNLLNSMRDLGERTFLMTAAFNKRKDIVGYIFSNQQHDLSVVDDDVWNVLHWIFVGNKDNDAFLMLKSLDISQINDDVINKQTNRYKRTPLFYAARKNYHKSIIWLMDQGADPSLKDNRGERPDEDNCCSDETKNII